MIGAQRRETQSRPLTEKLKAWAEQQTALPRSAEALGYLLGNWNVHTRRAPS